MENNKPLTEEINILIDNLLQIRDSIISGDREKLQGLLAESRQIKEELGE